MTKNEMLQPFSSQAQSIMEGGIYEHYKGQRYKVLSIARDSESLEEVVVYQALYGNKDVWTRPVNVFLESIFINGKRFPRFNLMHQLKS